MWSIHLSTFSSFPQPNISSPSPWRFLNQFSSNAQGGLPLNFFFLSLKMWETLGFFLSLHDFPPLTPHHNLNCFFVEENVSLVLELMEKTKIHLEPNSCINKDHININTKHCIDRYHCVISNIALCINKRSHFPHQYGLACYVDKIS
jgi:hypothetical protein